MTPLVMTIAGFRLGRGQNDRHGCWQGKAAQVRNERTRVHSALWRRFPGTMPGDPSDFRRAAGSGPWLVTLTRCSPSASGLDSHDNLAAAFKAVVDELAAWLNVNDGDTARVSWRYEQRRAPWGVELRIEARP